MTRWYCLNILDCIKIDLVRFIIVDPRGYWRLCSLCWVGCYYLLSSTNLYFCFRSKKQLASEQQFAYKGANEAAWADRIGRTPKPTIE